jgi:uncharacterized repeat protein (TIGR04138 family)
MSTDAQTDEEARKQRSMVEIKLHEIGIETGYGRNAIAWVYHHLSPESEALQGAKAVELNAEALCVKLVRALNDSFPGELEATLAECKLQSSTDIGRIVYGLVDKKLIIAGENDRPSDFDQVYRLANLDEFLAAHGIKKRRVDWRNAQRKLAWTLYVVGGIMVIASYFRIPGYHYGWAGWITGMLGWLLFRLPGQKV